MQYFPICGKDCFVPRDDGVVPREERPLEKGRVVYNMRNKQMGILPITEPYANCVRILFNTGNLFL